jgi:hypothetical protein
LAPPSVNQVMRDRCLAMVHSREVRPRTLSFTSRERSHISYASCRRRISSFVKRSCSLTLPKCQGYSMIAALKRCYREGHGVAAVDRVSGMSSMPCQRCRGTPQSSSKRTRIKTYMHVWRGVPYGGCMDYLNYCNISAQLLTNHMQKVVSSHGRFI